MSEECETCYKTVDEKTDPLIKTQAGIICSECHYCNTYCVEVTA